MALTREQINAVEQEFHDWMKDGSHIRLMTLAHHVSFLVDTIKEKDEENRRMRKALEAISASEDLYHVGMKRHQLVARQALADIDAEDHKTPQQSLEDSLKEMQAMRKGEMPERKFMQELDAGSGADVEEGEERG